MKTYRIFCFILCYIPLIIQAQVFDLIVAQDGSGNYYSLTTLINRGLPDNKNTPTVVFIKNGIYNEKVSLPSTKKNIYLIGESTDGVIITWNDYSGKGDITTATSYTFLIEGDDFYAENLTIQNTAGNVGQAVAIRTTGNRQVFKNCKFLGFQDTYYAHKNTQYNVDCYIEGGTDFIFGDATCVFENCIIHCVSGGQYITAPSDTKLTSTTASGTFYHGLLFKSCFVEADNNVASESYYLGRPWQPNASSVFINCTLGNHIKKEGWSIWSGTDNHLSGLYAEYKNLDVNKNLIDTTQRVAWSKQLTENEVNNYYTLDYFLKKDNVTWDPLPLTEKPEAPSGISNSGKLITWSAVNNLRGYIIYRDDSLIGFSMVNSFADTSIQVSRNYSYYIKSVSVNGNISLPSETAIITGLIPEQKEILFDFYISDYKIIATENVDITIYSMAGREIAHKLYVKEMKLNNSLKGIFLIKINNKKGQSIIKKIVF